MSALSAGTTAFADDAAASRVEAVTAAAGVADNSEEKRAVKDALAPSRDDALSVVVKWVPGEIIGTYAAVIAALQVTAKDNKKGATGAEWELLAIFMGLAFLMTVLGAVLAFRKIKESGAMPAIKRWELTVRGLLSCLGLAIWSYVIPGSVANQSWIAKHYAAAASAMVFLIAIVFGLFAEFLVLPSTLKGLRKATKG